MFRRSISTTPAVTWKSGIFVAVVAVLVGTVDSMESSALDVDQEVFAEVGWVRVSIRYPVELDVADTVRFPQLT